MKVFYAALFLILLHGIAHTQCAGFTLTVSDLQPPSCPNSSDGAITLSVDGAQGVVNYAWSEAGLSSPTIDGLAPGTYSVTATDEGGCQAVEMVVLEAVLVADAGLDITAYCGQDTVRLGSYQEYEVEIVENMFPIRIWNAAGQDVPYQLVPGKVGVGGAPSQPTWDTGFDGVTLVWEPVQGLPGEVVCIPLTGYNFTDIGNLRFEMSFDHPSLIYEGSASYNLANLGPGQFAQLSIDHALVDWGHPFSAGDTLQDGDTLFTICLLINEGETGSSTGPNITYQWTGPNGFSSDELYPLAAEPGAYTLRVTDTSQPDCWAEDEVEVLFVPDSLGVVLRDTLTPCLGQTVVLEPEISGGASPHSYLWSTGDTTQSITVSSSDTPADYALTITSADGCTGLASARVEAENTNPPVVTAPDRSFCPDQPVSLTAAATGGTMPYTFIWNDGFTTTSNNRIVTPTASTTYWVNVVDANGCRNNTAPDTAYLIQQPESQVDLGPDPYLCTPEQVTLFPMVTGPQAVAYEWSDGQAGQIAIVQPAQTSAYYLTITNSSGCFAIDTIVIHIGLQDLDITAPICDDNGTPANPDDDTFTFQATIDGNPGGSWFSNFGVTGSYGQSAIFGPLSISDGEATLTVVDGIDPSCNTSTVVQPPAPCSIPISCNITAEVTNFFCSDNGTPGNPADDSLHAFVAVEGGPGSGWNSNHPNGSGAYNSVAELVFAVADGVASLNVFDQDDPACDTTLVINPADFCGLPCNLEEVVQEIVCNDNGTPADTTDDSFTLEILVTGGPGSGWVEDSSGLSGDYGVPFTFGPYPADHGHVGLIFVDADDPSCFDIFDLYTPVPCIIDCQQNPILLNFDVVFPTCFGAADGEAIAIVEGGADGYTYQWSNGVTTAANTNLPGGAYNLTVTDVLGCQAIGGATIAEPPLLALDLQVTPVSCWGGSDGAIILFITGGTQPYTYFWTGPNGFFSTEFSLTNIPEGLYTVTVTDANGCSITETIEVLVADPIDLAFEIIQQPTCPTSNDGILMADATGGEGPYEYLWATGFIGPTHTGLGPGIYSVTVVDVNGCTGTGAIELEALLIADAGPGQAITCNDTDVVLDGSSSTVGPNILYEWTGPGGFISDQLTVTVSEEGTYLLQVTDSSQPGCTAEDIVEVLLDTVPADARIDVNYVSCDSIILSHPAFTNQTWVWTTPDGGTSTAQELGVTENGQYSLVATNLGNGCSAADSVLINLDPSICATLKGRLVRDTLPDCSPGLNEPGLSNWLMVIQGGGRVYYAVTQAGGYYEQSLPVGDYLVYPLLPNLLWIPCQNNYLVSLQAPGEMAVLDIPVVEAQPCPELSVNFSMPLLRRCWARSLFINYCNDGTAPAEDATVVVTLDDFFTFQSATAPLLSQDGNQYTFGIGDVAVNQCGSFIVYVEVSCDAMVGQSLCAEAKIFPNAPCFPPSPNWSGASLQVSGACEDGEVQFRVENVGAGDMSEPQPCIVIEDGVMLLTAPENLLLNSGESFTYTFPANGATYRIEVEQEPFHPGFSMPVAILEGCGENEQGTFSTGFVNQLGLDDIDPFIDIECREVVGSYDPNDKHGFPRGYGDEHYIYPGADIEYLVQFQNTGNDTAFLVVIRDTLSAFLDITSVHPGAASHAYTWDIDSNNILVFTFDDILLPDSSTNLAGSQGFIEFKIAQKENLPLGTVIENKAAIYFDINEPIITNTAFHTLGYDFIKLVSFTPEANIPELNISVAPNPMGEWALLQLAGWPGGEGLFELFGLQGRRLREQRFTGSAFRLERHGLPAGLYTFRIVDEQGRWGSGRLMIR